MELVQILIPNPHLTAVRSASAARGSRRPFAKKKRGFPPLFPTADRRSMIDFPFGIAFFLGVDHHRPLKIGHVWTFCIMVSLCGDFILRSRALEALVNTGLFASLHIHEGHRGIRCSIFLFPFSFRFRSVVSITRCACVFYFLLCDLLCIDTHSVSRHYRFLMRPLREPRLGHPYPCCFSSSLRFHLYSMSI